MHRVISVAFVLNSEAGRFVENMNSLEAILPFFHGWKTQKIILGKSEAPEDLGSRISFQSLDALVIVGGDGTLNRILLPILLKYKIPVVLFPSGTANDLASHMDHKKCWGKVRNLIANGKTTKIDLLNVNGIPFVTVGGIGIGSVLTSSLNGLRVTSSAVKKIFKPLGGAIYPLMAMSVILGNRSYMRRVRVTMDGFEEELETGCLLVCNQPRFAKDLLVAPLAKNCDGQFEILILNDKHPGAFLQSLGAMKLGRKPAGSIRLRTSSCVVESLDGKPLAAFGDGEPLTESLKLEFGVTSGALEVLTE